MRFLLFLLIVPFWADLYEYQGVDGTVLVTTEKMHRKGFRLVKVIKTSSKPTKRSSSKASKKRNLPSNRRYDEIIREAAEAYDLPFAFIKAVIHVESHFYPKAVSRSGAQGLMQLMPETAREMGVEDPFDPRQNIFGGTKYLRLLTNRYDGDINLLLSAYNAGLSHVDRYGGIPFEDTRKYVEDVYHWYLYYRKEETQQP